MPKLPEDVDIIVNIQGDEALVSPDHIDLSAQVLIDSFDFEISMLATKFKKTASLSDVKVALNLFDQIVYFSRADIPYQASNPTYYKAYHVVCFRVNALKKFCSLDQSPIELVESIEYMRAIENNMKIGCKIVTSDAISVDTPQDLETVRSLMLNDVFAKEYL